jgi:hypothetical protein
LKWKASLYKKNIKLCKELFAIHTWMGVPIRRQMK